MELCRTAFALVICLIVSVQGELCSCKGGCDNTTLVFPSSGGRIVDVAYRKSADMSSNYASTEEGTSGPACMAVNGKTGIVFKTLKDDYPNCVHTADGDTYIDAWWQVDLGRNYTVTNITIYRSEDAQRRMSGIHVEVDNQTCYPFPLADDNSTALDALPEKIDVTCSQPLTGRVVRLQKRGQVNEYEGAHLINICEVQVWGCRDGLYGAECVEKCENCKGSDPCSAVSGHCPHGCQPGWQGDTCKQECDAGKYGNNCSSSCGHCNHREACHHINGTCPRRCEAGFDPSDPLCERKCPSGSFGDDCSMKCSNCSQDRCDNTDGECLEGCKPGNQWTPNNHFCNESCQNGRHGENCSEQCGHCSENKPCNPVTGTCASCQLQFKPPLCKVCTGNRYGASCELNCITKCGGDGSCEKDTGRCVIGCVAGYRLGESGFCNETCEQGKYGEECLQRCGKCNGGCRHDNGHCVAGCEDGFEGDLCAYRSENSPNIVGPAAGGVIGGLCVIIVALIILLVVVLIRRSRKSSSSETASPSQASADQSLRANDPVELSNQVTLRVGAPGGLNRQAALQEETGSAGGTEAEENHYEGLQTPDDSDRDPYSTPKFKGKQANARNSHTYQNSALHTNDIGNDYYNL